MKKLLILVLMLGLIFTGCAKAQASEDDMSSTHIGGAVLKEPANEKVTDVYTDTGIQKTNEFGKFTKMMKVYGITFIAKDDISDDFMLKVAQTTKEMFVKTDATDSVLQEQILQSLHRYNALLPIVKSENDMENATDLMKKYSICDIIMETKDNQTMEVVEHILHAVTDVGLHYAMNEEWGLQESSKLTSVMNKAIDGKFYNTSSYKDMPNTIRDRVLKQEFAYWLITSSWNIQQQYGLGEEEWTLSTPEKISTSFKDGEELYNTVIKVITLPSAENLKNY